MTHLLTRKHHTKTRQGILCNIKYEIRNNTKYEIRNNIKNSESNNIINNGI